ncbi:hypothetical protein JCM1841_005480 [Sporobolomyces salmonicolor]
MDKITTIRAARHSAAPYDKNNRNSRSRTPASRDEFQSIYNLRQRSAKVEQQPAARAALEEASVTKPRQLRQRSVKSEEQPAAPVALKEASAIKPRQLRQRSVKSEEQPAAPVALKEASAIKPRQLRQRSIKSEEQPVAPVALKKQTLPKVTPRGAPCTPKSTTGSSSPLTPHTPPKVSSLPTHTSSSHASPSRTKAPSMRPVPSRSTALATRSKPYSRPPRPSTSSSGSLSHCRPIPTTITTIINKYPKYNQGDESATNESDSDEFDSDIMFDSDDTDSDDTDSDDSDSDDSDNGGSNRESHFTATFGGRTFDLAAGSTMAEQDELMDDICDLWLARIRGKKVKIPASLQRFAHLQDHTRFSEIADEA